MTAQPVSRRSMLASGEIDALISVDVPQALLAGSTKIARLFPDYEAVEREYYRRTGIFPPMHIVAVRKELVEHTDILRSVYRAFAEAKDLAQHKYLSDAPKQHMGLIIRWFSSLFEANRRLLCEDWWPYGLAANRKAVDTFLRYHEQGLSTRQLTSQDVFVPEFLDTLSAAAPARRKETGTINAGGNSRRARRTAICVARSRRACRHEPQSSKSARCRRGCTNRQERRTAHMMSGKVLGQAASTDK